MVSTRLALLSSFVAYASATVFVTNPTATSTCSGNSVCTVAWQDDGSSVSLTSFGDASVGVFVGSVNQQSEMQRIVDKVNVGTTASITFTVDPGMGQDSSDYFIRFQSIDAKNGTFPVQAFSAKFTLNGMTGKFNQTILDQIANANAASSSAAAASSSGGSGAVTTSSVATGARAAASSTGTGSSTGAKASGTASASGAGKISAVGFGNGAMVVAGVAALVGMMF